MTIRRVYYSIFVSTADSVTVTGMAQKLLYVPHMDSFAEYAEDSWTYDGRFVSVIQVNATYYCNRVVIVYIIAAQHSISDHQPGDRASSGQGDRGGD